MTSPGSSGPYTSLSAVEEGGALPPIEEDSGRYLVIPVQEEPIQEVPSVSSQLSL